MDSNSQNRVELDYSSFRWPSHGWSLLSVRAWVRGMRTMQVAEYKRVPVEEQPVKPTLPDLDPAIKGTAKFQLDLAAAGLEWEWEVQSKSPELIMKPSYRRDAYQTWLPVQVEPSSAAPNTPDPLAILCPSDLVAFMLDSATSMLVLRPGAVNARESGNVVEVRPGPCLTLAQGFLTIEAHLPLHVPPTFPLEVPLGQYGKGAVAELQSACEFARKHLPGGTHYWLPMLPDPQGVSALRY